MHLNKVTLIGRIGKDPEIRMTQDGMKIASLSLATSESWLDKSGERKEKTEWHKIVVMNAKLAEVCEKYLRKGSLLFVEGQIQTRKWSDQAGQVRYTTEIVIGRFRGELIILSSKNEGETHDLMEDGDEHFVVDDLPI